MGRGSVGIQKPSLYFLYIDKVCFTRPYLFG
jgi:hypothetical protein